jgi:hypothetical protein
MRINQPAAAGLRPRLDRVARLVPMLAAGLLAACGDGGGGGGTGPVVERVASVTLTGAPTGPVLAGTTVQLAATPVNASGAALQKPVTWTSADTSIAKVSGAGTVSVVGAGSVAITASADGKEASATLDARAGGEVGPAGGTLALLGGRITLAVPPGSLDAPMTVLFRAAPSTPVDARAVPGTAFQLSGPPQLLFRINATLILGYDPARLPAGVSEGSLQLYELANPPGGAAYWSLVRGSRVDAGANQVRATIPYGGTYAVVGTLARTVTVGGEAAGGALYVGQTRSLAAVAVDVNGDTLAGAAFTWTTSDGARTTVDALGRVTGQSAGTAAITASLDGKSASTTVTVLPRPVAAWNQAAEWGTAGGNGRHDGYVAATLDPSVFRKQWDKQFPAGLQLQPVATGAGKVFVEAGAFNASTFRLSALDAADGTERWYHTLSGVSTLSPPAFGEGRVYLAAELVNQGSRLIALDAADGGVRFSSSVFPSLSAAPPIVDGGGVYVGGMNGSMHRADAATGAWSWNATLGGDDPLIPAVNGGQVVVFRGSTYNVPSGIVSLDAATGAQTGVVTSSLAVPRQMPVLGGAGNVIGGTASALLSAPLQPGGAAWTQGGFFPRTPVVGQGTVYAVRSREVAAFRENDGALRWVWTPPSGEPWVSMLVTDNLLFVSVEGFSGFQATYAIDVATGKQVWYYPARGFLALSADGTLYIAAPEGLLTAISVR